MKELRDVAVGTTVRYGSYECYVGEKSNGSVYVWSNISNLDGCTGSISPSTKGFKYSYEVGGSQNVEIIKSSKSIVMNLKEKFAMLLKAEPEKSFIKAGITTSDDVLTDEGQVVFLSWLLKKNGADFKSEVVDPLLADTEKKE